MGDTDKERVLDYDGPIEGMPHDVELEAPFDPHEAPTKPGIPPGLSDEIIDVRADLRALLVAASTLFDHMEYDQDAFRHTATIGEARHALRELARKYGVTAT